MSLFDTFFNLDPKKETGSNRLNRASLMSVPPTIFGDLGLKTRYKDVYASISENINSDFLQAFV